jgi:hypothetical protein
MATTPTLTTTERDEITAIYAVLDVEWRATGKKTPPERQPFAAEDIIEWGKLTPVERIKGLRAYAWASDRAANVESAIQPLAA